MDHEQLAFANHQLAGMLRAGIPLEGAIRELCATMRKGELRGELERLESDLAGGMPFAEAMERRRLPEL
ncbi:MAG TPA: type II secretion system F family protein, partial [Methylomirabilota bacterium]|nr:type II secretion system F family protein [Methylomirabilota bacterium]